MSLHVITSLLETGDIKNVNKLEHKFFTAEELQAFQYVEDHLHEYKCLPSLLTCRQEGFILPEAPEGFDYYLANIKDRYAKTIINNSFTPDKVQSMLTNGVDFTVSNMQAVQAELESLNRSRELTTIYDGAADVRAFMYEALAGGVMGITTGSSELDTLMHGWKAADFGVIFARPGVGKTFTILEFARAALYAGKKVLFINNEMSDLEVQQRFWASIMSLNPSQMYRGDVLTEHFQTMDKVEQELKELGSNMYIFNPENDLTTVKLRSLILELRPDVVFIDSAYLLAPNPSNVKSSSGSLDRLNAVVKDIRNIAKHLELPIVAVAQANRSSVGKKSVGTEAAAGSDYWSQMASFMLHLEKNDTDDKTLIASVVKNRGGKTTHKGKPIQYVMHNDFDHMNFGVSRLLIPEDEREDAKSQEDSEGNMKWD